MNLSSWNLVRGRLSKVELLPRLMKEHCREKGHIFYCMSKTGIFVVEWLRWGIIVFLSNFYKRIFSANTLAFVL